MKTGATIAFALWLGSAAAAAQTTSAPPGIEVPPVEVHRLQSKHVGDGYEIRVLLPPMLPGETARFPVVYLTDATGDFAAADNMLRLLMMSDTRRFIAVGIGYPGAGHFLQTTMVRRRDLTPVPASGPLTPSAFAGALPTEVPGGGAAKFLAFIREELMPFVDQRYPTDPADRTYFGHSFGGLFGCYVLFSRPDTFTRYIIGSPSIWWEKEHMLTLAEQYTATHDDLKATVFIGIGALEEAPSSKMVTNVFRLERLLRARKYPNLALTTRVFADESHITVMAQNLVRGLVTVLGPPPPEEEVLAKYRALTSGASKK